MTVSFYIKLYLATLVAFFLIDMIWLGLVARTFYRKHLGFLLSPSPNWIAASLFYLLFIAGIIIFAVVPGLQADSLGKALLLGALFGLISYATYDLTNLATIKDWPLIVTVVDMIWGTALATTVAWVSFLAGRWLM
ncbi:MAG: DUF2177 family protein [Anaerolineales bacterium]|nr:MAG: DUF2177 family protein [Anaerolineales bacterium]